MTSILDAPLISETRRNHGLEHATIHILSERFPNRPLAGHSNPTGFFIVGNVPTDAVRDAVAQALARMQNGESQLAIHPGCGTNYALMGGLVAFLSLLGFVGTRDSRERWDRLPLVAVMTTAALIFGQPIGTFAQKYVTTSGDPGALEIVDVYPISANVQRVITRG
jgi:hypothetical protein